MNENHIKNSPRSPQGTPENVLAAACAALDAWERGVSLDDWLDSLPEHGELPRRVIASLLFAFFRHRAEFDARIAKFTKNPPKRAIRHILQAALAQVFTQDGIPTAIAVDVAVSYTRKQFGNKSAGFVNAILRRAQREELEPLPAVECLPKLIRERWLQDFGDEQTANFAKLFMEPAPMTFRLLEEIPEDELNANTCYQVRVPEWAGKTKFWAASIPAAIFATDWLKKGRIYIQDPSTVMAPTLATPVSGTIVDLCSAPGGKALLLAERMPNARLITADRSSHRQQRTIANFANSSASPNMLVADASSPALADASADLVLLDVPCSNTAVFRRRPDAIWRFSRKQLAKLIEIQADMLQAAVSLLKPGAQLIYSTCSLETEENSGQIQNFLAKNNELSLLKEVRILPDDFHDGAYAALMTKTNKDYPRPEEDA